MKKQKKGSFREWRLVAIFPSLPVAINSSSKLDRAPSPNTTLNFNFNFNFNFDFNFSSSIFGNKSTALQKTSQKANKPKSHYVTVLVRDRQKATDDMHMCLDSGYPAFEGSSLAESSLGCKKKNHHHYSILYKRRYQYNSKYQSTYEAHILQKHTMLNLNRRGEYAALVHPIKPQDKEPLYTPSHFPPSPAITHHLQITV
ncbi:hypothetical protein FN846DRAFT_371726 [Sphaerosporella brunnea]|uniref:Uncharacterized protein n=1 Tax=Sphaerosporella brunnea TaxID=1250544 RepID=A0A5J5EJM1_9PEZI|nr:hypothetical protein FN846DRAFT_371726 [Sphaerosporella brunnea]